MSCLNPAALSLVFSKFSVEEVKRFLDVMKEDRKLDGVREEEVKARSRWSRGWRDD